MKTLADLLRKEAHALETKTGHIIYLNYPYSCCLQEAMMHSQKYQHPRENEMEIEREPTQTTIKLKPLKGSRRRKKFEIKLWSR